MQKKYKIKAVFGDTFQKQLKKIFLKIFSQKDKILYNICNKNIKFDTYRVKGVKSYAEY